MLFHPEKWLKRSHATVNEKNKQGLQESRHRIHVFVEQAENILDSELNNIQKERSLQSWADELLWDHIPESITELVVSEEFTVTRPPDRQVTMESAQPWTLLDLVKYEDSLTGWR